MPDASASLHVVAEEAGAGGGASSQSNSRRGSFQDELVEESLRECATPEVLAQISTYIPAQVLVDLKQGIDLRWHSELREITTIFVSLPEPAGLSAYASACQLQRAYTIVASETSRIGGAWSLGRVHGAETSTALCYSLAVQPTGARLYPCVVPFLHLPPVGSLSKVLAFDKGKTIMLSIGMPGAKIEDGAMCSLLLAGACFDRLQSVRCTHCGSATMPKHRRLMRRRERRHLWPHLHPPCVSPGLWNSAGRWHCHRHGVLWRRRPPCAARADGHWRQRQCGCPSHGPRLGTDILRPGNKGKGHHRRRRYCVRVQEKGMKGKEELGAAGKAARSSLPHEYVFLSIPPSPSLPLSSLPGFHRLPDTQIKGKLKKMAVYQVNPSLCEAARIAKSSAAREEVLAHEGVYGRATQLALFTKMLSSTSARAVRGPGAYHVNTAGVNRSCTMVQHPQGQPAHSTATFPPRACLDLPSTSRGGQARHGQNEAARYLCKRGEKAPRPRFQVGPHRGCGISRGSLPRHSTLRPSAPGVRLAPRSSHTLPCALLCTRR